MACSAITERYCSTTPAAQRAQVKRSSTRRRPALPRRAPSSAPEFAAKPRRPARWPPAPSPAPSPAPTLKPEVAEVARPDRLPARSRPRAVASAPGSPGGTSRAASPSGPRTSGRAPPALATTGASHAIASTAGSENPSYSDGTATAEASAYISTSSSSLTPGRNVTAPSRPSRSIACTAALAGRGSPTTTRWASGSSVLSLARASRR